MDPGDRATIRVGRAARVVFERRRFDVEAAFVVACDEQGTPLMSRWNPGRGSDQDSSYSGDEGWQVWLHGDLTRRFRVGANADHPQVSSDSREIARVSVQLQPGVLNRVVWTR